MAANIDMAANRIKIPQYRILYEKLRKHIEDGVYSEGDLLPSENELCNIHNLTRPTVRQALAALVNDGFIKKQQGKGSIVHRAPRDIGILSIQGTTSAVGDEKLRTHIIVKPQVRPWGDFKMFPLTQIERESGCIYVERLRWVDDRPVFYDVNYIPNINVPRFSSRNLEDKSLFTILREHYQIEIVRGEQRLMAIPANTKLSKYLKVRTGQPILYLERKMETNRVDFNIYSSFYCNTRYYSLYGSF